MRSSRFVRILSISAAAVLIGCVGEVKPYDPSDPVGDPSDNPGQTPDTPGSTPGGSNPGGSNPGGGNPGDTNPDPNPGEEVCEQFEAITIVEDLPPDLLLVMDTSGSMDDDLQNGDKKLVVMREALQEVVATRDQGIHFGLMTYPTGVCSPGGVRADVAANNANDIIAALDDVDRANGGTPTATTMLAALQYFQTRPANPAGSFVLLATDGEPTCLDGDGSEPDIANSITAISSLAANDVDVFVLGFGDTINASPDVLLQMAQAGGTGTFYAANSPEELAVALEDIAGKVSQASCIYELDVTPGRPEALKVDLNGNPIDRDPTHTSGWDYDAGSNAITFYGAVCDAIKNGAADELRIDFGCIDDVIIK